MRHDEEVDALVADRYLDALLAGAGTPGGAGAAPDEAHAGPGDTAGDEEHTGPDDARRDAARVLRAALLRVHPSFRFEERLAGRLADLAAAQAPAVAAGGGAVIPFPGAVRVLDVDPLLDAILRGELDPADGDAVDRATSPGARRPLIVGGAALTSAAISLVGVAYVAWRASRPVPGGRSNRAMARAARAARARRAAAAGIGIGSLGGSA